MHYNIGPSLLASVRSCQYMLFKQYNMRQKAEMASVAQGKAKCYISIKGRLNALFYPWHVVGQCVK